MDDREIPIQEIRKCLDMSPNQFINFLNIDDPHLSTSYDEEYYKYKENLYPNDTFFNRNMLDDPYFTVHMQDWIDFKENNPNMVKNDSDISLISPNLPLWGWLKVVYDMKIAGKSDKEIAIFLLSKDIKKTQIGILLYPTANVVKDWRQVADGILDKEEK